MRRAAVIVSVIVFAASAASASETATSPYAGLEARQLKALSADEIAGLREGQGMALALAAELNGHPGPLHVLELADRLALDEEQRVRTRDVFDRMKDRAKALGREVLGLEAALEDAFGEARPEPGGIERLTAAIGAKRGALRAVHLVAHVEMDDILKPEQRRRYAVLRGYRDGADSAAPGGHQDHQGHGAPRH